MQTVVELDASEGDASVDGDGDDCGRDQQDDTSSVQTWVQLLQTELEGAGKGSPSGVMRLSFSNTCKA